MEQLREEAARLAAELEEKIAQAAERGFDLPYARATSYCARLALTHRWERYEDDREHLADWTRRACRNQLSRIEGILAGRREPLSVPPVVDVEKLTTLRREGWYWVDPEGRPQLLLSFHTRPPEELAEFFVPWVWSTWVSGVGATRYDFRDAPIWEAYLKYPETHRVYGGGWCGHIIKDKWSMGGAEGECIICLESPRTREAVVGYIEQRLPEAMRKKGRLISLLDYEYVYVCYCDYTKQMFRDFVRGKHGRIDTLNERWGTEYASFDEVELPPMTVGDSNDRPDGTFNPAQVHDFYEYNLERFSDYMRWAKSEQRKIDPTTPIATCAPHYNFTAGFGESGSDVELMALKVNDILLNESGPSTKYVDFLRSITPEPRPIMDVESSALTNTLASYLHGEAAISVYWGWSGEPTGRAGDRLPFGDKRSAPPVEDAERMLRTALDIRRLAHEITELATGVEVPAAMLYSRASLLQVPQHVGNKTAYLMALDTVYRAMLETGRAADFVTTRQVLQGKLHNYRFLVVPAVTFEQAAVYEQVMGFVDAGNCVFLVPNSFFFDEYLRPRPDYLGSLGLEVEKMRAPVLKAGEARTGIARDVAGEETEAPFIQGLIIDTVQTNIPKSEITPTEGSLLEGLGTLNGAGVRQWLKATPPGAEVLARFGSGEPALIEILKGEGSVYYLCQPLETTSYSRVFSRLLDRLGCAAPLAVTDARGGQAEGVEYRSLRRKDGTILAYVNNLTREDRDLQLRSTRPITRVRNLSLGVETSADVALPGLECYILEIETR